MDAEIEGTLGLNVLYTPPHGEATVDIVAVHGLGANPQYAWVAKVPANTGSTSDSISRFSCFPCPSLGKRRKTDDFTPVNWLVDLLPTEIPEARIMTFNYLSRWHRNAPHQDRRAPSDILLEHLHMNRERERIHTRPLIFIGHSFGGNVIEQMIISASSRRGTEKDIPKHTAGIVFLGTPHRGSASSNWGSLIVQSGRVLGLDGEDRIVNDLKRDSEALKQVVREFTGWLFDNSVPTVCFYEQHVTDYGSKAGGLFTWKEMVVDERSACLDCSKALPLPKDHLKLNKYTGPDDSSFRLVCGQILRMANLVSDPNRDPDRQERLASLEQSNPLDCLSAIKRAKERTPDTCTWILEQTEYKTWFKSEGSALLRIEGGPGTGKTVLAAFLVDELESARRNVPDMAFAYFFCDNKDENRKSATSILRSFISQLLRQTGLFRHVKADFERKNGDFLANFEALWRIITSILHDRKSGKVFLLIDALDECDKGSRKDLLGALKILFDSADVPTRMKLKIVLTCRREDDIQEKLNRCSTFLAVDQGKADADLTWFISNKCKEISEEKAWPDNLRKYVQDVLIQKAGGTFLWASLVLKKLEETRVHLVKEKLLEFPAELTSLYNKLLSQLRDPRDARVVLQLIVSAIRPLSRRELAIAFCLEKQGWEDTLPSDDKLDENIQIFTVCEHLVYLDEDNNTVHLIHQSTKEFLLGENQDFISSEDANGLMFRSCWRYLTAKDVQQRCRLIWRDKDGILQETPFWEIDRNIRETHYFLRYAFREWLTHAIASERVLVIGRFGFDKAILEKAPTFRDTWLLRASAEGQAGVVRCLLELGAEVNSKNSDEQTSLLLSAKNGHKDVAMELLACDNINMNLKDNMGCTALMAAVMHKQEAMVELLLQSKRADVKIQDVLGATVLHYAASEAISDLVITMLLNNGADINAKDSRAGTPFTWALGYETVTVSRIKFLFEKNVEIEFFYRPWVSRSYLGTKCDYGTELGKLDPEVYASC
ncbi:hypothetical protein V8E54_009725 [Elaphomyces granulatus]